MSASDPETGFDLDDRPIRYMERTRTYYAALGYPPYRWAYHRDVPFRPLEKPLAEACVALITTAAPFQPGKGDQGPSAPYNGAAKFFSVYSAASDSPPDLRISHIAYDRDHTSAADSRTYFPLEQLKGCAARGRIGRIAPRFHGVPTNRSQRRTVEVDAPEVVSRCLADQVDVAILLPNCPVCHQTVALTARQLEAAGISTVVMGCAKDIVEHCGIPRFLFSDFPLGNCAGRPDDVDSQALTMELALRVLESAPAARTTVQSPLHWSDDPGWKRDYADTRKLSPDELRRRQLEFEAQKKAARSTDQAT